MNFYRQHIAFAFLIGSFCSCGTGVKISKSNFKPVTNSYSGIFDNKPFLAIGKSYLSREKFQPVTLIRHFDTSHINTKTASLTFNIKNQLVIIYKDSSKNDSLIFNGKFSRRGYYEIFFSKKRIEIPPILPLFYSHRDINRLRIALTKKNDLVIDHDKILDGNFLFVGGGEHDRTQNFYHFVDSVIVKTRL